MTKQEFKDLLIRKTKMQIAKLNKTIKENEWNTFDTSESDEANKELEFYNELLKLAENLTDKV
jgi:hypothetical protein